MDERDILYILQRQLRNFSPNNMSSVADRRLENYGDVNRVIHEALFPDIYSMYEIFTNNIVADEHHPFRTRANIISLFNATDQQNPSVDPITKILTFKIWVCIIKGRDDDRERADLMRSILRRFINDADYNSSIPTEEYFNRNLRLIYERYFLPQMYPTTRRRSRGSSDTFPDEPPVTRQRIGSISSLGSVGEGLLSDLPFVGSMPPIREGGTTPPNLESLRRPLVISPRQSPRGSHGRTSQGSIGSASSDSSAATVNVYGVTPFQREIQPVAVNPTEDILMRYIEDADRIAISNDLGQSEVRNSILRMTHRMRLLVFIGVLRYTHPDYTGTEAFGTFLTTITNNERAHNNEFRRLYPERRDILLLDVFDVNIPHIVNIPDNLVDQTKPGTVDCGEDDPITLDPYNFTLDIIYIQIANTRESYCVERRTFLQMVETTNPYFISNAYFSTFGRAMSKILNNIPDHWMDIGYDIARVNVYLKYLTDIKWMKYTNDNDSRRDYLQRRHLHIGQLSPEISPRRLKLLYDIFRLYKFPFLSSRFLTFKSVKMIQLKKARYFQLFPIPNTDIKDPWPLHLTAEMQGAQVSAVHDIKLFQICIKGYDSETDCPRMTGFPDLQMNNMGTFPGGIFSDIFDDNGRVRRT